MLTPPRTFSADPARRRGFVRSAVASAIVASLVVISAPAQTASAAPAAAASAAPANAAGYPAVTARRSESVVDAYGIGIHSSYWSSPYGDTARVIEALRDLGVEHVRDDLWNNTPESYVAINRIAREADVKFDLIMGNPSRNQAPADYVATVEKKLLGSVEAIEGPNEWDNFGPSNWVEGLRTFQSQLYKAAKANPATRHLPVLAPAMAFRENIDKLGRQTGVADIANSHLYPGGRNPSVEIGDYLAASKNQAGTALSYVTEAGYHNAVNTTGGHFPAPENVSATYLPRMLAEHVLAGTDRLYTYELIDGGSDPKSVDQEANFGMLRADYSPKPQYNAMRNMLALLDDTEEAFTPGSLSYRASGAGNELRQLLTQRSDGTFVLLLWRDVSIWAPYQRTRMSVDTENVTVSLPQARNFKINQPNSSAAPTHVGTGSEITIPMGSQLVALTLSAEEVEGTEPPTVPTVPTEPTEPTAPAEPDTTAPVTVAVEAVQAAPRRHGAKVKWKIDGKRKDVKASHTTWKVRVFRGKQRVRTLTRQEANTRSVKVKKLSPRFNYRFAVVADVETGPSSKPATSRYVKPRRGQSPSAKARSHNHTSAKARRNHKRNHL